MRVRRSILVATASIAALSSAAAIAAPTSNSCLWIDDARNVPITIEVDGYSGYWVLQPNTSKFIDATAAGTPTEDRALIRSESFSFRVYEGDARVGAKGSLYDSVDASYAAKGYGTTTNTFLTYIDPPDNDARVAPECRTTGYWNAVVH